MGNILFMKPVFKEMIWGGTKLRDVFQYEIPSNHTGECWAISGHHNGDCLIDGGEFDGIQLSSLYQSHRSLFGNVHYEQFPLMVKIIDASKDLSVQVHPDDAYAMKYEQSMGKAECWYVLDVDHNTNMVMGHNALNKEQFVQAIEEEQYDTLLKKRVIQKGDFFDIKTGTIHAICAGSLIYEAQQSSDITYRVYDYNRTDALGNKRELHVQKSIDVTTIPFVESDNNIVIDGDCCTFVENEFFSLYKYDIKGSCEIINNKPFMMVSVIEGSGIVDGYDVVMGSHFIVCSDHKVMHVEGNLVLMVCTL